VSRERLEKQRDFQTKTAELGKISSSPWRKVLAAVAQ